MIQRIIDEINSNSKFLITSHEYPDGDAVGSSLALASFLSSLNKEFCIYLSDPMPESLEFLPLADKVVTEIPATAFDVTFVVDAGDISRTGIRKESRTGKIINIDHHPDNTAFGDINYLDPKASATGAMIYRLMAANGFKMDYSTALCLYTAIATDTGSFRYSNADKEAFQISGQLVDCGINPWFIAEKLFESQPRQRLDLLALALSTLEVNSRGDVASITVSLDMYAKTGATSEVTDGFINFARSIRGVEVAVFFREIEDGRFKVGFRSKGKVDVSVFAAAFGGGGHHNAAGCKVSGPIKDAKHRVVSCIEKVLEKAMH